VVTLLAVPGDKPDTIMVQAQTCTGVVIGPRTVLTAKHCIGSEEGTYGKVIMGYVKILTGEMYPIRFRSPDPREDIALLMVSEPMGVEPAKIAPKDFSAALTLEGYGCLQESSELPLLRSATYRYKIENMLFMSGCVCHGDSGGPVFDDQGRLVALMVRTDNEGMTGRGLLVHDFLNAP
jgi:S1-C subfamily serine protease